MYNIEVEGDHCYRVGGQGLLVHNTSGGCGSLPSECRFFMEDFSKESDRNFYPEDGKLYLQLENNPSKGARAKGVKARLCKQNIGGGTSATANISGWDEAETILTRRKTIVDRAHLLAKELGGSGSTPRNLVVACADMNKKMWNDFESIVHKWITDSEVGVVVDYLVTVEYDGDSVFAKAITLTAVSWDVLESCKEGKIKCKEFMSKRFESQTDITYCLGGVNNPRPPK